MEKYKVGFVYDLDHISADGTLKESERAYNLIPTAGVEYLLNATMAGGAQFSTWYLGLFENDRTIVASDTMATLIADCGESSAYGGTDRLVASFAEADSGTVTTVASPTEFTFTGAATIRGAFLTTGVLINGTAGLLLSAVKFASPKVMASGEILRVPAGLSLITT